MTQTVYVVTSGVYSNYTIAHVFATKDLAQSYIDAFGEERWGGVNDEILEMTVHQALGEQCRQLTMTTYVTCADGAIAAKKPEVSERLWFPVLGETENDEPCSARVVTMAYHPTTERVFVDVRGTDYVRVRKTFAEQVAQTIAEFDLLVEAERKRAGS